MRKIALILCFCTVILFFGSKIEENFETYFTTKDDLYYAQRYIAEQEWILAESMLQRFLRVENNSEKRWDAWMLLLKVSNYVDANPATVHVYLSDMLQEFFDVPVRKKFVLFTFANLIQKYGDYAVASDMWNMYLELDELSQHETFVAYSNLGVLYFRTRQYALLEDTLYSCMALEIDAALSSQCMYDLAYMKSSQEEWDDAKDLLKQILSVESDDYTQGRAAFLMGDILEQQKKHKDALKFFETARLTHPNAMVVDRRIEFLQKNLK